MKKTWTTPRLIVLVRNNPPEAVLSVCKSYEFAVSGPTTFYASQCWMKIAEPDFCGTCSGNSNS